MRATREGWIVEDLRDAPMRARAWFATWDDARAWAREKFGDMGCVGRGTVDVRGEVPDPPALGAF